ncbi:MAG: hypothetical protein ABR947_00885 [Solirubrobacteraceae bacterium]
MRRLLPSLLCAGALAVAFSASASAAVGSVQNLRDAASTVVSAEIHDLGSSGCSKLYAPLTKTIDGKTCVERWAARSKQLLAAPDGLAHLLADYNAVPTAVVTVHGLYATIALPYPLLDGQSKWYWTDNCWMLMK